MTRKLLRQYQDTVFGIDKLRNKAVDSVKASHKEFPYTTYCARISGEPSVSLNVQTKLSELYRQKQETEKFIDKLPNVKLQQIAWMYANGESWNTIAAKTNESIGSARQKLLRAIKDYG